MNLSVVFTFPIKTRSRKLITILFITLTCKLWIYNFLIKYLCSILVSTEKRTTLAFEHAFDNTNSANAQKEVVNKLKEFCELSKDAVKVSTAKQFTELVRLMKTLDSDSMESVHKKVHSGKVCPKNTKVRYV